MPHERLTAESTQSGCPCAALALRSSKALAPRSPGEVDSAVYVDPELERPVTAESTSQHTNWRTLVAIGAITTPVLAVLWLGITLVSGGTSVAFALVKIVFTIAAVATGIAGVRWATAAGIALLLEALAVAAWIALKVESYPAFGALRTALLLAAPLGACGVLFILADGMRAGTWPPTRSRASTEE